VWFKNVQAFHFMEAFRMSPEALSTELSHYAFRQIRPGEVQSRGWANPNDEEASPLVYPANGFFLICLRTEDKMVPSSVVREMLSERLEEWEQKEGRKAYKKEKEQLKDEVFQSLLGRAFSKNGRIYGLIDPVDGWLFIDAASSKKAELFTTELRRALGSLRIQLPPVDKVSTILTSWVRQQKVPSEFKLLDHLVIEDLKTDGLIRAQNLDLFSEEIQSLLEPSREVIQLALSWCEQLSFVLKQDFSVKSLKFLGGVKTQASEIFTETAAQQFDADFVIMAETLRAFWRSLYGSFKK